MRSRASTPRSRSSSPAAGTEVVLDRLDEHAEGSIRTVLDRIGALEQPLGDR